MAIKWKEARKYQDILYHGGRDRQDHHQPPRVRNAFRPQTVMELMDAFAAARGPGDRRRDLTGAGDKAFCSGGDQRCGATADTWVTTISRSTLDLRGRSARFPSPSSRWWPATRSAAGTCCTRLRSDHRGRKCDLGQTGPKVGSFDAGYGATLWPAS